MMNNEQENAPFIVVEEDIPFGQRISDAIQRFFTALSNSVVCLFLAPIIFFRVLFTKKRKFVQHNPNFKPNNQPMKMDINLKHQVEENEPWKQAHDELYGDYDEDFEN